MKQFFQDNGATIKKLYLNQFGAIVFGIMIVLATVIVDKPAANWVVGFISLAFYMYLIFLTMWEKGASDRLKVDGGRMSPRPNEGLKIGIAVCVPMLFFALIYLISILIAVFGGLTSSRVLAYVTTISSGITRALQGPYIGLFNAFLPTPGEHPVWSALFWLISLIPAILMTWLSYFVGYDGKYVPSAFKKKEK